MIDLSIRGIAAALHGEVAGAQVLAPGPNHDPCDRSLSIKLSAGSPDGFLVHSFAGDTFQECRDHVKSRLGLALFEPDRTSRRRDNPKLTAGGNVETSRRREVVDADKPRTELALALWREGVDPRGTIADAYLRRRALELTGDVAGAVLRFHPACPWRDDDAGGTIYVPAMVAAMRSITTDTITAIHRTRLSADGQKIDRRMLGVAAGAAIKLDPDDSVTHGLHICEGLETGLAARQFGLRPAWALGSAGAIAAFPVLAGIECLSILVELDAGASDRATAACADRWAAAGREVIIISPTAGKDLNDGLRARA